MSGDTLVYDLSTMTEGTPQVFVKKDWLNILDNQNGNYQGNQSVVDTSQLANSNKYMNYREAYLAVPMLLTASSSTAGSFLVAPQTSTTSADLVFGLKNWFGSIIHSFTLDYNGTTIIQQTSFCGMYNCFRLMTTLSLNDITVNGADMGFYPDDPLAWGYSTGGTDAGIGTVNNANAGAFPIVSAVFANYDQSNEGLLRRQQYIAFDLGAVAGVVSGVSVGGINPSLTYGSLFTSQSANQQYKSYIFNKTATSIQYAIMATIHLKHIHNFFQNVPLLKGVFMKMTINLNQTSVVLTTATGGTTTATYGVAGVATTGTSVEVQSALGGVSPIMIASAKAQAGIALNGVAGTTIVSLAVGSRPTNPQQSVNGTTIQQSPFTNSIQLYVPAYTFAPSYEDAYLSSPVKTVVYTDIYQYQFSVLGGGSSSFNQLITNGIANIKSVLVIPYYASADNGGLQPYQSPFDPAGAGATSPLCLLTNFNVVVAGANMIYNTQQRSYEQFLHQLRGCNAVNADMTDGLTSGLISKLGFEMEQSYYYVDCSRMLPVEEAVPKSVSIIGTSNSQKALNFFVFVEYGVQVSIDVLTGSRV
jgi:hypothetical protein